VSVIILALLRLGRTLRVNTARLVGGDHLIKSIRQANHGSVKSGNCKDILCGRTVGKRLAQGLGGCERDAARVIASRAGSRLRGGHAQITACAFGGIDLSTGQRFVFPDIQGGGNGGRPYADGSDGQDSHLPRFMNTLVEAAEQRFPIRVERYELVPDSGGAEKFRGILALRRDIRVLTGPVSFARYADRHAIAPQGLFDVSMARARCKSPAHGVAGLERSQSSFALAKKLEVFNSLNARVE
jgi:hypothetical protein